MLPAALCRAASLRELYLSGNELQGPLPPCITNLSHLEELRIAHNKLSGELPRPDHRAGLLIANHQLDTDWFYLWDMLRVVGAHGALKIVLLDDMRSVPIVGWCMRLVGFIFVSRHRKRARQQDDVAEIERAVAEADGSVAAGYASAR